MSKEAPAATKEAAANQVPSPFPLPRAVWVPDAEVSQCHHCSSPFTQLNRRHHCRQCGDIFCKACCSQKMVLPQYGFDKPERVCERCIEVAGYVSYAMSSNNVSKCSGARRLAELAKNEGGMHKLVSQGGIDTIIYLCYSSAEDVLAAAVSALDTIAQSEEVQNTLVVKGALVALFRICTSPTVTHLPTLISTGNVLFTLSRNADVCRAMVAENGLHPLMALCSRKPASSQSSQTDQTQLAEVQTLGARAISYLAMTSVNQGKIIEDKKNGLDQLLALLSHQNPNVRKYIAKTFAYLSLRNDKLKTRVLRSDGITALVALLQKGNLRETLSHVSCTIANLATNGESNEALLNHGRLVTALCSLSASMTDDTEIQRHIIRGLANFALYDSNKAALLSAIPEIVRLSKVPSADIQRHAIRAIDNLLNNPTSDVLEVLRENHVADLLRQLSTSSSVNSDVAKRAAAALDRLSHQKGSVVAPAVAPVDPAVRDTVAAAAAVVAELKLEDRERTPSGAADDDIFASTIDDKEIVPMEPEQITGPMDHTVLSDS